MNPSETKKIVDLLTLEEVSLLVAAHHLESSGHRKDVWEVFAVLNPSPICPVGIEKGI